MRITGWNAFGPQRKFGGFFFCRIRACLLPGYRTFSRVIDLTGKFGYNSDIPLYGIGGDLKRTGRAQRQKKAFKSA